MSAPDRVAYANLGAEAGAAYVRSKRARPPAPVLHLATAFERLVEDPPWPWLERARGLVPWLATDDAARAAASQRLPLWGADPRVVDVVHDKAFAVRVARDKRIDTAIVDLCVVLEPDEVTAARIATIAEEWPRWAWRRFTVKPRWGTSGRGRVAGVDGRVQLGASVARSGARAFMRGAVVEPWLVRVLDLSSLWFVDEHGEPHLLGVTLPIMREAGVYLGCDVVISDVGPMAGTDYDEAAVERARVIVEAAAREGYRGPCGVDAFVWRDDNGAVHLRGAVELNARFTAGHVALGLVASKPRGTRWRFRLDGEELLAALP